MGFRAPDRSNQESKAKLTAPGCCIKGAVRLQEDANSFLFKAEILLWAKMESMTLPPLGNLVQLSAFNKTHNDPQPDSLCKSNTYTYIYI